VEAILQKLGNMAQDLKIISFKSPQEWEKWLAKNHVASRGIWLKIFKKDSQTRSVSYLEALEGALCYGWIDGQKAAYDDKVWLQKFSPRQEKSVWSKINVGHAERLIKTGRMKPEGLKKIVSAKKDGRWSNAYHPQSSAKLPKDFLQEVSKNKKAKAFFGYLEPFQCVRHHLPASNREKIRNPTETNQPIRGNAF